MRARAVRLRCNGRYRRMGIAPKTGEGCLGKSPNHEYAIQLYSKALRGMRKVVLYENKDIRMVLIACLLVVCFEGLHGSPVAAMTHAAHGVKLLHRWLETYGGSELSLLKPPAPDIIEDELIYVFNRLDLQVLTFFDTRPVEYHKALLRDTEPLKRMPTLFLSLRQARAYWDYITPNLSLPSISNVRRQCRRTRETQRTRPLR
jgi:hypothetical protein